MSDRVFTIASLVIIGLCLALTVVHLVYAVDAYQHSSIIYFIGKELW